MKKNYDEYFAKKFGWSKRRLTDRPGGYGNVVGIAWVEPSRRSWQKREVHSELPKFSTDVNAIIQEIKLQGLNYNLQQVWSDSESICRAHIFTNLVSDANNNYKGVHPAESLCKALEIYFKNHPVKRQRR